ncbi:(2Fe-2S)-binding protein [Marinobacterium iners]|uniref:(2Fe-2S)-binding protein n=1 Tax=Acinetobacter johnsonii TaxID=40214 RepID=A0A3S9AQR3_ACIJO|nr:MULTISPECIES: non-heme iron oxygenase ferredoxin subunit [Gammaproteobacteria]AZN65853.1 (2Fe-2S)-binding protein [Acinetobacter johnsonii]QSR36197.1 (2Fe-2S)-binding protein [Marinobacterium iners]
MNKKWVKACMESDILENSIFKFSRPGKSPIAIYRIEGKFYATEDTCTHGIASLSEGEIDGDVIECPFHGGAFNICTGEPESEPCTVALKTYQVDIVNNEVLILEEQ